MSRVVFSFLGFDGQWGWSRKRSSLICKATDTHWCCESNCSSLISLLQFATSLLWLLFCGEVRFSSLLCTTVDCHHSMKCKLVWQWIFSQFLWRGEEISTEWTWCCWSDFRVSCCFSEKFMNDCSENKTQQWNHSLASIEELPAQENNHTRAAVIPPQHKIPSSKWRCQFLDTGIKLNNDFLCFTKQMLRIVYDLYDIEEVVEGIRFLWRNL